MIDSGDPSTAVRLLEVLTRNRPTNEQSWLELSRGLVALGRRHDALAAVQRARGALRAELGVDLSTQLARFEIEILDGAAFDAAISPSSMLRTDNLRPDPDGFVARTETDQLWAMLTPGTMVTLVGPGGIGKTRCAQAVGHRAVTEGTWSDGVWLVDLTTLSPDAPDIAAAVSIAIGAGRLGSLATSRSVVDYLGGLQVLLILDNCEHVRAAVRAFIADLFASRCTVAVLATSRIRLGVPAERIVALDPMSMSAACQLFDARVSEIGAGRFEFESVEALCAALDCYPLAIELAAARTRTLSAREIVERLDRHPALAIRRVGLDLDRAAGTLDPGGRHASLDVPPHTRLTRSERAKRPDRRTSHARGAQPVVRGQLAHVHVATSKVMTPLRDRVPCIG